MMLIATWTFVTSRILIKLIQQIDFKDMVEKESKDVGQVALLIMK